jgi:hypothetical protein
MTIAFTHITQSLPSDVTAEIIELPTISKALLLNEIASEVTEAIDGFEILSLSATTTQWLKSLTIRESLILVQTLARMITDEVQK